jgi:hypothetical protein
LSARGGMVVAGGELLSRQLVNGRHDRVGGLTSGWAGLGPLQVAEVQGLPEPDGDLADPWEPCTHRLDVLRSGECHRHDRTSGGQGQPGHASATAVEATVTRSRPLRIDTQRVTGVEDLQRRVERLLCGAVGSPADGDGTRGGKEPTPPQTAYAFAREVVRLGKEDHAPRGDQRDDDAVDEREVVAGQKQRPGGGDVLAAFDDGPVDQTGDRSHHGSGEHVEHGSPALSRFGPVGRCRHMALYWLGECRWFRGPIGSRPSGWVGDVGSEDLVASGRMRRVLVCLRPLSPFRTCPSERHEPCPHADAVPLTPDKKQETPQPWPSRFV